MVKRVSSKGSGNPANWVSKDQVDNALAKLSHEDMGELEPEIQDLIQKGTEKLDLYQRQDLLAAVDKHLDAQAAKREAQQTFWSAIRERFDAMFKQVQTFIRAEKAPTRFSMPPLGQGEKLDLWSKRMSRVIQSWRRGRRVDVTVRLSDAGDLTLYFDDFGELDKPVTFACRISKRGELFSVDYQPGQGEVERMLGDTGREQMRQFMHAVLQDDRGHKDAFTRFARRMTKADARARAAAAKPSEAPTTMRRTASAKQH